MKVIVIGLGNFGTTLALRLTEMGHEVVGIDKDIERVNALKDEITLTIQLDCTLTEAVENIPLKEADLSIVCIGEDEGASILSTAVIKQHTAKRIISRAVTPVQETVLEAMGIEEIVHPERQSADRLAKRLSFGGVRDTYEITRDYNIVEAKIPAGLAGKSLKEIKILQEHNILVLTTLKETSKANFLGGIHKDSFVNGVANAETVLEEGDYFVLFGHVRKIKEFLKEIS